MFLKDVLRPHQKIIEHLGGNGHVLDEGERADRPLQPRQQRDHLFRERPQEIDFGVRVGFVRHDPRAGELRRTFDDHLNPVLNLCRRETRLFDDQGGLGVSRESARENGHRLRGPASTSRRSSRSQALGCCCEIACTARIAASSCPNNSSTTPRCAGSGAVCSVAAVNNPSVPSEPTSIRASRSRLLSRTPRR